MKSPRNSRNPKAEPATERSGDAVPNLVTRIVPLLQEIEQQAGHQGALPLPIIPSAAPLPPWAVRVCQKMARTVLKIPLGTEFQIPLNFRQIGRLVGFLLRAAYWGLVEMPKEAAALGLDNLDATKHAKLKQAFDLTPVRPALIAKTGSNPDTTASNEVLLEKAVGAHVESVLASFTTLMLGVLQQPPPVMVEFLHGLPEGYTCFLTETGSFTGDKGRTNLYMALLVFWPEIEALRERGLTRGELYKFFCEMAPDIPSNQPDWFQDICDEIGLSLKKPGAPKKRK